MPAEWQALSQAFANAVLAPDIAVPAGTGQDTPKRFAVYRNNVNVGLINALEANFPALRKLLGGAAFLLVAASLARHHPPKSRLMFEYGESMEKVLSDDRVLADFPYLADVAQLERLYLQSHNEADAFALDPVVLSSLTPDALFHARFIAHPALRLLSSGFAVVSIWKASRDGLDLQGIDLSAAEYAFVTRPELDVQVRAVSHAQFLFLRSLATGASLGEAAELAAAGDDFDLAPSISLALRAGAFTALKPKG